MRIEFSTEGGIAYFPGLSKPLTIDSEQLPEEQAAELGRLIEAVNFFELPTQPGKPKSGAADHREYTITLEEGLRHKTVRVRDPIENAHLEELVTYLQRMKLRRKGSQK